MPKPVEPANESPFHEGEIALQRSVGVAERMDTFGRKVIRNFMPDQHRDFYRQLPFVVAATVDGAGNVWPTILTSEPGFMHSPEPTVLDIGALPYPGDPAREGARPGAAIGLLGIELHTRRRNRMNGVIAATHTTGLSVTVGHAFGNCPQYIQLRDHAFARDAAVPPEGAIADTTELTDAARAIIEAADTFFVASYVDRDGERQIDASHRGGKPGFVRIGEDGVLTIPDFAGNLHFNTLGNFMVNPRAGLLFVDFETGDMLQLAGTAQVITDSPEIAAFQGAERLWTFRPVRVVLRRGASALRWAMREDAFSPNSLMTGSWEDASARLAADRLAQQWRTLRITRIIEETGDIRSFYLEPIDGHAIALHKAGQHLPVRAALPGEDTPTSRVYTLSSAPSDPFHRISVKRQGAFSHWLHDRKIGDTLEARAPSGAFHVEGSEERAAVLIAAGIGVTPMLAMLRQIVFEGQRLRRTRPTWFVHVAKSRAARAFHEEIGELVAKANGAVRFIAVHAAPDATETPGVDYSWQGRFSAPDLSRFLPFGDYDFYVCGPSEFMQETYDGLISMGVSDGRVHAEAFGPSSLERRNGAPAISPPTPVSTQSVSVLFAASAKEARWEPGSGTLLELAEKRGLTPEFSCRSGSCGMCAVKLARGKVTYPGGITAEPAKGEILLCSAVPAQDSETLEIDV